MMIVPLTGLPSIEGAERITPIGEGGASAVSGISGVDNSSFASIMKEALETYEQSKAAADQDAYDLAMGDVSSLHSMMINSAMQATAMETVVQVTSRAVTAYKEIMQMQV